MAATLPLALRRRGNTSSGRPATPPSASPACPALLVDESVLIHLERVNVALNGTRVLHDITWTLRRGENWAVFGPNGAGKSTFLRLLRGEIWPAPVDGGMRIYAFDRRPTQSPIGVKQRMALVSAEQQQRYLRVHARKYGDDFGPRMTVRQIVFTGLLDGELVTRKPTPSEAARVTEVMREVGIEALADCPLDKLSQGQLRKALIARAVVARPDVLILDEVGVGLDAHSRRDLLHMIQRIAGQGTQILMTTHRRDELIPAITHVMELRHGRITAQERRNPLSTHRQSAPPHFRPIADSQARDARPFLINIIHANVAPDEGTQIVLHDVNWRMNEGEHWMIVGDNGVGKSTLLRLILGELWPAHGGRIERFGRSNFDSVWEIKKRIGYVSCEFQARYAADLTTEQVIASGFFASIGWLQPLTRTQRKRVNEIIARFDLQPLAKRSILEMSYGQARKVLIARALVNSPRLLILDEVFDGLDQQFRAELAGLLEEASREAGIILVTHHEDDCLPFITHRMVIRQGRIVAQEERVRTPVAP
ncbi:MAG: ATP-binding cassette domain-containing protein [Thermoflexales bacterium]|nr:ATP-binding cassette domain-containing protein [Thermoflexales bacterium]MDW8352428.1 ATP-binding cassette domain-containing protein [Anaerolineae bacterium]